MCVPVPARRSLRTRAARRPPRATPRSLPSASEGHAPCACVRRVCGRSPRPHVHTAYAPCPMCVCMGTGRCPRVERMLLLLIFAGRFPRGGAAARDFMCLFLRRARGAAGAARGDDAARGPRRHDSYLATLCTPTCTHPLRINQLSELVPRTRVPPADAACDARRMLRVMVFLRVGPLCSAEHPNRV